MFPVPPMIAFRQPAHLKKKLCRAKLYPKKVAKAQRTLTGAQACNKWFYPPPANLTEISPKTLQNPKTGHETCCKQVLLAV